MELLVELLYLTITTIIQLSAQQFGYELRLISPITQLLLIPVQISVLVYILIKWNNETYEIHDNELIIRHGTFKRTEKAYPFRNMQSVIVRQSILERLVGAGTVYVFVPTLGTDLIFSEVPNPIQFSESIRKSIPNTQNSQFILRK